MAITDGVPKPVSYRLLQESKVVGNLNDRLVVAWLFLATSCYFIISRIPSYGVYSIVASLIIIIIYATIFFVVCRDVATLDRNYVHLLLLSRVLRKKHVVVKYVEPLDDLKKIVPISSVEDSGLIRYNDKTSGVLIWYVPPRTAKHNLDHHSSMMQAMIDSLYGGYGFQFLSNSVVDPRNYFLESISESMKNKDLPGRITEHVYSLYEEAKEQRADVGVEFALLVTFPKTKTVEKAEQLRTAFIPHVLDSFSRADVICRVYDDRTEVIRALWRQLC